MFNLNFAKAVIGPITKYQKILMTVDMEKGNEGALGEKNFTNISVAFCCNPILQDVENWVKRQGERDYAKAIKEHVEHLIDFSSPDEFDVHYYAFSKGWSEGFLCFAHHLKADINEYMAGILCKTNKQLK